MDSLLLNMQSAPVGTHRVGACSGCHHLVVHLQESFKCVTGFLNLDKFWRFSRLLPDISKSLRF